RSPSMKPAPNALSCPECEHGPQTEPALGRRDFIRVLGTSAAAVAVGGLTPLQKARAARAEKQAQAEALVFELFGTMDSDQKAKLVLPWDHQTGNQPQPARLMTANAAVGKSVIGLEYNRKQVELLDRIFRAISNGEEGYKRLSRNGKFDNSGDFESIGAVTYGEPAPGKKFSLVFSGHHLTVRCDGNSEVMPTAKEPWTYWRLEGPGFVWSFRSLPHIHTCVSVTSKLS